MKKANPIVPMFPSRVETFPFVIFPMSAMLEECPCILAGNGAKPQGKVSAFGAYVAKLEGNVAMIHTSVATIEGVPSKAQACGASLAGYASMFEAFPSRCLAYSFGVEACVIPFEGNVLMLEGKHHLYQINKKGVAQKLKCFSVLAGNKMPAYFNAHKKVQEVNSPVWHHENPQSGVMQFIQMLNALPP